MRTTTSDLLSAVAPELGSALLSAEVLSGVRELGARLPELDNARYLECRLGPTASNQVDYLMSLTQAQAGLLGRELSARGLVGPGMAAAQRLGDRWTSVAPEPLRSVPITWLEFDDVDRQARQPIPAASVCVCLAPSYGNPFANIPARPARELVDTIVASVRAVCERELAAWESQLIERCIDHLPPHARWIHLSMMTARRPTELKLYGIFPRADLLRYLRAIEWPGTLTTLSQFLGRYHPLAEATDNVYVDLPLAPFEGGFNDRAAAGLGLCFSQQQLRASAGPHADASRAALLEALTRDGLCTAAQVEALSRWPSTPTAGPGANRWLDIKLVYRDARPLLAKAYLGFTRRRVSRGFTLTARASPG